MAGQEGQKGVEIVRPATPIPRLKSSQPWPLGIF